MINSFRRPFILTLFVFSFFAIGCADADNKQKTEVMNSVELAQEKAAILETLNEETKAFFDKNYEGWQAQWVHESFVAKTYMRLKDSTQSETLGWPDIDAFGKTYMQEHPEPEPLPTLLSDIEVRLYHNGAWVTFEQNDALRGLKRETRLMEKVDGQWKIASMHTTIYGIHD